MAEKETRIYDGPGERFKVIGKLNAGQWAEVAGVSLDAKWWVIQFPMTPDGLGWVLAQDVDTQGAQAIGSKPGMTLTDNQLGPGTPQLVALKNIKIMAGPGVQYETLGYLETGETAAVIGVSPDRQWWAIKVPYYKSGRGWVPAGNVKSSITTKRFE